MFGFPGVRTLLVAAVILLLFLLTPSYVHGTGSQNKRVLVLHSYHSGYSWTDDIQRAVIEVLGRADDIELHVEYLDFARNPHQGYDELLLELLKNKYVPGQVSPDVVLISDDRALEFSLEYRSQLFPNVPIVFCGINDFTRDRIEGHTQITGVNESKSITETLDLALRMNPATERIAVVGGARTTERYNYQSFLAVESQYSAEYEILHLNELEEETLVEELGRLGEETVVLYFSYMNSPSGTAYHYRDALRLVTENTDSMVFVTSDFQVCDGAVGGKVVHGYAQGEKAARVTLDILEGADPDTIPIVMESPNKYRFDERMLERFNIPDDVVPDRAEIVNKCPERLLRQAAAGTEGTFFSGDLFDQHGAVMLLIDAQSGYIVAANEAAYEYYGYSYLRAKNIATINVLSQEQVEHEMQAAVREQRNYFSFRHELADGMVRDVSVYSYPVTIDDTELLFSVVFDVTDQRAAEEANRRQAVVIITTLTVFLFTALTAAVALFALMRKKNKAEEALQSQLRISNSLLNELHHRTKNSIQVIDGFIELQAAENRDPQVQREYAALRRRIATIAMAHQRLDPSKTLSYVNLRDYLHAVVSGILASNDHAQHKTDVCLEIVEIDVLIDIAVPCGLIVNELLSDSLQRAVRDPSYARFSLALRLSDSTTIELVYEDDRLDGERTAGREAHDGLGVNLARELSQHQLGGRFRPERSESGGTRYVVTFSTTLYKDRIAHDSTDS